MLGCADISAHWFGAYSLIRCLSLENCADLAAHTCWRSSQIAYKAMYVCVFFSLHMFTPTDTSKLSKTFRSVPCSPCVLHGFIILQTGSLSPSLCTFCFSKPRQELASCQRCETSWVGFKAKNNNVKNVKMHEMQTKVWKYFWKAKVAKENPSAIRLTIPWHHLLWSVRMSLLEI